MVIITQLIYILDGQESVFEQFEEIVIPSISKFNGHLLIRLRPDKSAYIQGSMECPYEIHVVEFTGEKDFADYMNDEGRRKFLHLKEQSIRSAVMIKGVRL